MDAATLQAIGVVGAMVIALLALIGGWVYWLFSLRSDMNHLRSDVDRLDRSVYDLRADMERNYQELRADMDRNYQELRNDMDRQYQDLRADMERNYQELQANMDRNHQAVLTLLQGHTHADEGAGAARFHNLPGTGD